MGNGWTPERRAQQSERMKVQMSALWASDIGAQRKEAMSRNESWRRVRPESRARHSALMVTLRTGATHSLETRLKMAESAKGNTSSLGRHPTEETRRLLRRPKSAVTRARMSAAMTIRMKGRRPPRPVRTEWLDCLGRLWRFRSKMELRFAEYLDREQLTWSYEPHRLLLSDGHTYKPDFWVDEWATYVEVKGWVGFRAGIVDIAKRDGHPIRLLYRRDLTDMGVALRG